jgi:hypothetical protein
VRNHRRLFWLTTAASVVIGLSILPARSASSDEPGYQRVDAQAALSRLVEAYPSVVEASGKGAVVVGGKTLPLDRANAPRNFDERLALADLIDQVSIPYPQGCPATEPSLNEDPGRLRDEAFFTAMYGSTQKAVAKRLTMVNWFGQKVAVTTVNGVNSQLAAVAADLSKQAELKKFVAPSAGTFNFRVIAGTKRLSVHSFGAAIDSNTAYSDYWRWDGAGKPPKYRNRIPCDVAEVFERHGFIWGAKWYHYDTMHFEYRPELLNG